MKLLERNYQDSLQTYLFSNEDETVSSNIIRQNLLSRLSQVISGELNEEDKSESLIPNIQVKIIKVRDRFTESLPIYIGRLNVTRMKFPVSDEPISDSIDKTFKNSGVDLPSPEFLDSKLERSYSSGIFKLDPFQLSNLEIKDLDSESVTDKEFSYIEKEFSEINTGHLEMLKAVSILAMHKHLKENPRSNRQRLLNGIDNLTRELTDPREKKELKDYLIIYVDNPKERDRLAEESDMFLKSKSDKAVFKSTPLWVIMSVISVILLGAFAYSQRDKLKSAWDFSKIASKPGLNRDKPKFSRKKSFFKALFSSEGRSIAKSYLNNKEINKTNSKWLDELDLLKREAEVKRDRSSYEMDSLMNKFYKNDR